ncbi:MAG: hypothetical protein ACE5WD_12810 [Candidatus Aminicenantia bacterium]
MKKVPWRLVLILAVVIVAFIALGIVYATGNKAQEKEKAAVTSETHGHQEGSAECKEAHKSGKCTGHEPGEHQHSAMSSKNPGHGHKEGSAECKEAHKSGKCTGHEPGEHQHSAMSSKNPGHGHKEGSAECKEAHKTGKCQHKAGKHPHTKK